MTQFAYKFQLLLNGQVVREFRTSSFTEWHVTGLDVNLTYGWRARAEQGQMFGPWSATWTFKTPDIPEGYIAGGEVYDPLWTGKTVGNVNGAGRVHSRTPAPRWYGYVQQHRVHAGADRRPTASSRCWSPTSRPIPRAARRRSWRCAKGGRDITTNDRRFTIEKRGDPAGDGRLAHDHAATTRSTRWAPSASSVDFAADKWYLWTARWGGGRFNLTIREDGAGGTVIYNFGKSYAGAYDPNPHMAYVGAPVGRGGANDATVPGMIAKQVWLSHRPRPDFANR